MNVMSAILQGRHKVKKVDVDVSFVIHVKRDYLNYVTCSIIRSRMQLQLCRKLKINCVLLSFVPSSEDGVHKKNSSKKLKRKIYLSFLSRVNI